MKLSRYMDKPEQGLVMEEAQSAQEREVVIFGELAPDAIEVLKRIARNAQYMEQYQWLQDNTSRGGIKGQLRVRKIKNLEDDAEYILTTKAYDGPGNSMESEVQTDNTMFLHFKAMAPSGQVKTRYSVDIPGSKLVWEIDVIHDQVGEIVPWAKIDLEIPADVNLSSLPALPEGVFTRVIDKPRAERSREEEAILNDLFDNKFFIKNPTVEQPETGFQEKISRKAMAGMLKPFIEPLVAYVPAISYDESYLGVEEPGVLKSQLKELEYAYDRLLNGTQSERNAKAKTEDCDCEDE